MLGIHVLYINAGESFGLGRATFTCLNPALGMVSDSANEYSTVLYMEYTAGNTRAEDYMPFTALFTGDVEGEGLSQVKRQLKGLFNNRPEELSEEITLLKVAHHGSRYTTDEEFLELVRPQISVISCGRDNSYGHPHEEVLKRLGSVGTKIYRTDLEGCISMKWSGNSLAVDGYCN